MELNRHPLNAAGLNAAAALSGYTRVLAAHAGQHDIISPWVLAEHAASAVLLQGVRAGHAAVADLWVPIRQEHTGVFSYRLLAAHAAPFGNRIAPASHAAGYSLAGRVRAQHTGQAVILGTERVVGQHTGRLGFLLAVQHVSAWGATQRVAQQHAAPQAVFRAVQAQHAGPVGFSAPVAQRHALAWDVQARDPVRVQHTGTFDVTGSAVLNISGEPYVELGGQQVAILGADLAFDEGGYVWTTTVELARVADYQAFTRNAPFTVVLFGDRYEFIVDSKGLDRSAPGAVSMTVSGSSPVAMLDVQPDRAAEVTRTWTEPALASEIVRELAGSVPVDWRLLDWTIPAHRLGVAAASPISVIQQIARAAGGVAEATPTGALLIRPAFPVTVPEWGAVPADQVFTDAADNLSVRDGVSGVTRFNRLYLADVVPGSNPDRIEWVADEADSLRGELHVYPAAWRENLVVTSTRTDAVLLPSGVVSREEDEVIEIAGGTGAASYPVDAILAAEWLDTDLGGVVVAPYSTQVSAGAGHPKPYSLLRLRYRTRAIVYQASYPREGLVQFIVEEL